MPGKVGHEHFGFKDGVSQPGLRGVDAPNDPIGDPDQGHPGQDLLWPGEFVLGYRTQIPHVNAAEDRPNPDAGPVSSNGPGWSKDGSYLVFRRPEQGVPAFNRQIAAIAAQTGLSTELVGAKLVGRYRSGCLKKTEIPAGGSVASGRRPRHRQAVLEAAVNGRASAIVTHNVRNFLPAAREFKFEVITPSVMLQRMSK